MATFVVSTKRKATEIEQDGGEKRKMPMSPTVGHDSIYDEPLSTTAPSPPLSTTAPSPPLPTAPPTTPPSEVADGELSPLDGDDDELFDDDDSFELKLGDTTATIAPAVGQDVASAHIEAYVVAATTRTVSVRVEPDPPDHHRQGSRFSSGGFGPPPPEYSCTWWELDVPRLHSDCTTGELRDALGSLLQCDTKHVWMPRDDYCPPAYLGHAPYQRDDTMLHNGAVVVRMDHRFTRPGAARVRTETRGGTPGAPRWQAPMTFASNHPSYALPVGAQLCEVDAHGCVVDRPAARVATYEGVGMENGPIGYRDKLERAAWLLPPALEKLHHDRARGVLIACRADTLARLVRERRAPRETSKAKQADDQRKAWRDRVHATDLYDAIVANTDPS